MRTGTLSSKLFLVASIAILAGCATSRSEIRLSTPAAAPAAAANPSGPVAVIRTVNDDRKFGETPNDPSVPSLGFEGAAQAPADVKSRAIGRKRNAYGKALGDVLLESGQTVESVIRENLAASLQQAGYQVKAQKDAPDAPLMIDVSIGKFWAWLQPGFWAIKLHTQIATDLRFNGANDATPLALKREESLQIVTDGAWMEGIGKALEAYRAAVANAAASFPKTKQ